MSYVTSQYNDVISSQSTLTVSVRRRRRLGGPLVIAREGSGVDEAIERLRRWRWNVASICARLYLVTCDTLVTQSYTKSRVCTDCL